MTSDDAKPLDRLTFSDDPRELTADQLDGFFEGWPNPPSADVHLTLLQSSYAVVVARDEDKVIGFANAVSDGVLTAYIPLLEVVPAWRGQGVATTLIDRLKQKLRHLYMIDLCCDEHLVPFYERLGFTRSVGMLHRNYDRQSGE